jgi:predicted ATPase
MMADRMLATSFHFLGDQRQARHHIELMLGHYEMPALDPQILRFQFDQRVTAHYFQARILWLQGFADQAIRVVNSNIDEARSVGNALSMGSVLGQGACPIALFTGDLAAADHHGAMLLDHAERHALQLWQAWARAFNAVVMVKKGNITDGLQHLRTELTQVGQARFLPRYLILVGGLADALGQAGEAALGLETVDEALKRCAANDEGWYVPELLRIRGELVLQIDDIDAATAAESHFLKAFDHAEQQGALSWSLRSAVSLARLRRDQGRTAEAYAHLSAIYSRFSEGFATGDLQAASQLLSELN